MNVPPPASPLDSIRALETTATVYRSPCGDGRMVWRSWGAGPPLVLLHGGYGSWTHWLRNIPALSRRYRVIAPDLPCLGDSDTPPEPHTPESLGRILADGLEVVLARGETAGVAGFSFGGMLGACMAAARPERVERLVLIGAGGTGLRRDPLQRDLTRERPGMDDVAARRVHRDNLAILMFADPANIDELAVELQVRNTRAARVKSRPLSRTDALSRAIRAARPRLAGIWGEFDITTHPYTEQRRQLIREVDPEAPFVVMAGIGHWVAYEAAEAFNALLPGVLAGRAG